MNYTKQTIEGFLRNYTMLSDVSDSDFVDYKLDLDRGLKRLLDMSENLYRTVVGVFVYGNPIQKQADAMCVSKRQVIRRMDDGLIMLTLIMNGEFDG